MKTYYAGIRDLFCFLFFCFVLFVCLFVFFEGGRND